MIGNDMMKKTLLPVVVALMVSVQCGLFTSDKTAVAEFGKQKITLGEFRYDYEQSLFYPSNFDSPANRRAFLQSMIDQRLLAERGYIRGLQDNEVLKETIRSYREKLAGDEYLEHKVFNEIEPTDEAEMERVFRYLKQERLVRHLFSPSREKADSLYVLLQLGKSFESLARTTFHDTLLANNGGLLGWVSWNQLDYNLANSLFELKVGELSQPVRSRFGYHIVRVENVRESPLFSGADFEQSRVRIKYIIDNTKRNEALQKWQEEVMSKLKINVKDDLFQTVAKVLAENVKPVDIPVFPNQPQLAQEEIAKIHEAVQDYRSEAVASYDDHELSVGDFIIGLVWVPRSLTIHNPGQALAQVIQDEYISGLAWQSGYDHGNVLEMKAKLMEEALIQKQYRADLVEDIKITEDQVRQFYEDNKERYQSAPNLEIRELVFSDEKQAKRFYESFKSTTREEELLHNFSDVIISNKAMTLSARDRKDLYQRAMPLKEGGISLPQKVEQGYSLVILDKKIKQYRGFNEIMSYVYGDLLLQKQNQAVTERLAEIKRTIKIKIHDRLLKKVFQWD
jgi:parvulin-like peptidyl-prolyl isomerase